MLSGTGSWASAVYCTKACQLFRNECVFHPPLEYWKKHSINKCQSGERCLFTTMKHGLQVADSDTFGMKAELVNVLMSELSCGGIDGGRRMSFC